MARKNGRGVVSDITILFWIRERPASGYDIRKMLEHERVAPYLNISSVTVYQALRRLEDEGFVSGHGTQMGNYPKKTVYSITPKGIAYHDSMVEEFLRDPQREGGPFHVGLTCAAFLPVATVVAALHQRLAALQARLDTVRHKLAVYPTLPGMQFPEWIHLVREQALLIAEIQWLDNFAKDHEARG